MAAVTFISHKITDSICRRFGKLARELPANHDLFFLYNTTNEQQPALKPIKEVVDCRVHTCTTSEIIDVDYPNPYADADTQDIIPGNNDLLFIHFQQLEPTYSRYWFIEYDVAYTGHWEEVFREFDDSSADLIGTTLTKYENQRDWYWWPSLRTVPRIAEAEWVRGFFPIVRLSEELLRRLDAAYMDGWSGHFEAVLPTLAHHCGLELEDMGGEGAYVTPRNRNRFYTNTPDADTLMPGTFVYRPVRPRPGLRQGKLWHPIKPTRASFASYLKLLKGWAQARLSMASPL